MCSVSNKSIVNILFTKNKEEEEEPEIFHASLFQ